MLYKPNFCCNCGEKIERAKWTVLTSRRFCGICETEYKGIDYLPRAAVVAASVIMLLGAASYLRSGNPDRPERPRSEATQKRQIAGSATAKADISAGSASPKSEASGTTTKEIANSGSPAVEANSLQRQPVQKTSTEAVYYCGALTRKGTACTRRVKTKGRCWQHQGMPAAEEFR